MSSPCPKGYLLGVAMGGLLLAGGTGLAQASGEPLRVCADPNNLPFSNERLEGFENRLASMLADDLGRDLTYVWWPQRRGFLRQTLFAGRCDVLMGVPVGLDRLVTTRPYYRSGYVFVGSPGVVGELTSFAAPALHRLRIGVQLVGDDGANTPPAHLLTRLGIVDNVRGYTVYGDYGSSAPAAAIVEAVARGDVDLAIAWGPVAGFFARRQAVPLSLAPLPESAEGLPMRFAIALGVRPQSERLALELEKALERLQPRIDEMLRDYGVPLLGEEAPD